jgi:hypothetical protein
MRLLKVNRDGSENKNEYIDVYNVRVSLVEKTDNKDWEGSTGRFLRFSAYTGKGKKLMRGPELPLSDKNVLKLVRAIMALTERSAANPKSTHK